MIWTVLWSLGGLDSGKNPSHWAEEASGNYFDALRLHPYLGRFFHAADEHGPNSAPYVVLCYAFWHSHFQDDRGVVGSVVRLNGHPFTVIGVAPPEFHRHAAVFRSRTIFAPIVDHAAVDRRGSLNERGNAVYSWSWASEARGDYRAGHGRSELDRMRS